MFRFENCINKMVITLMTALAALTLAGPVSACDGSAGPPPIPTLVNAVNLAWGTGGALVYGIAVDPITGNVYAADAFGHIWAITQGRAKGGPENYVDINPDISAVYAGNPFTGQPAITVNTIATVVGAGPGVGIDPKTGNIYVGAKTSAGSCVLVFNELTNSLIATIPMSGPEYLAVNSDTGTVYVTNVAAGTLREVVVIDEKTNAITATIPVTSAYAIALDPQRQKAFTVGSIHNNVCVIDLTPGVATTNTVIAIVPVGSDAVGIDVDPKTGKVYVSNYDSENISVIDENTLTVVNTISDAGYNPLNVVADSAHGKVYVLNLAKNPDTTTNTTGIVIDETTDTVTGTFNVFPEPRPMALDKKRGLLYIGAGEPNQDASLSIYKTRP